jgi:hypothetical protein
MNHFYKPHSWNALCDVCGFKFKAEQLKKRWDGLMTCDKDWEMRNPQDFLKVPQEAAPPPWTRPDDDMGGYFTCSIFSSMAITGQAIAGCAVTGKETLIG